MTWKVYELRTLPAWACGASIANGGSPQSGGQDGGQGQPRHLEPEALLAEGLGVGEELVARDERQDDPEDDALDGHETGFAKYTPRPPSLRLIVPGWD